MIKINLLGLPKAKTVKKTSRAQSQILIGSLILLLTFLISLYGWYWLNQKISRLSEEKGNKERELVALKEKVKEVENIDKFKQTLEEKIKIIDQLKKNQSGPVHLLDELSKNLPERVWINSFTEQAGNVDLEGKAMTNKELVEFIENLNHSHYFQNVQLIESRSNTEANTAIFAFKIKFLFVL